MGFNFVIQSLSYCLQRRLNTTNDGIKDIDETFCGLKVYLFLFPSRSSIFQFFVVILLSGLYGSLMTYFIHITTLTALSPDISSTNSVYYGLTIATVILSSYPLFS
jgi:hypothetical protein